MSEQARRAKQFLELHHNAPALLMPNPWDEGSAKLLASLGFRALATTSGGFAATLGRRDGDITRAQALEHCRTLAAATALPLSADLENGFADAPEQVAETVRLARETGLAGCSIEDYTGDASEPIYPLEAAGERIAAAAEAAHAGDVRLVLTARAENHVRERPDLSDTITRLQAYEQAGADVLFAPGLVRLKDIRLLVEEVQRPVNVLVRPGGPSVAELAGVGVARISVGGAFAMAALGAVVQAAEELAGSGTLGFLELAGIGGQAARRAFG